MVLVFQHPSDDTSDGSALISAGCLERVLRDGAADKLERCQPLFDRAKLADTGESTFQTATNMYKRCVGEPLSPKSQEHADRLSQKNVQMCLLQDLYEMIPSLGFDITAFSSIDNDEIFVCVALTNRHVLEYLLMRENCQLQLRQDMAKKLGIEQNTREPASSPASMLFDMSIVKQLHKQGLLKAPEKEELFRQYAESGSVSVVSSRGRVDFILRELAGCVDLGACVEEGLMHAWYPVHNPRRIEEFRVIWAYWRGLLDLSFIQPVPHIRDYFGDRIAFFFAWNGLYCKTLTALVAVSTAQGVLSRVLVSLLGIQVLETNQVVGFSMLLVVWAKISANLWDREQSFFLEQWNLREYTSNLVVRPQFNGTPEPSPIDANIMEEQYPRSKAILRLSLTGIITILFCTLVALCIFVWLFMFDGEMGIVSSLILSVQIKIFEFVFHNLAQAMTDSENHRFDHSHHNSLLWKLFLFDFVNNYTAFFAITLRNAWIGKGCAECLSVLQWQLSMTLCVLCLCSITMMVMRFGIVRFRLWLEVWLLERKAGKAMPPLYRVEEEAKYVPITETDEVQNMTTVVLSLGFVLLFGGISATVVPLCFLVFAVQLRSLAVFCTTCAQRPIPQHSFGIGHWRRCIYFLMAVGVIYSSFLFVAFGESFQGAELLAKMTGMMLYCSAGFASWGLLDMLIPPTDSETVLLVMRRDHVTGRIMKKLGTTLFREMSKPSERQASAAFAKEVQDGAWDDIPQLAFMQQGPLTPCRSASQHFRSQEVYNRRHTV
mmetsp:Transcript_71179/g.215462  ORF Transcript_71179/g.215462 Transcript_71179/m.215462 type:complete len:773 (-) Transcript_71179:133-2451(-)